MTYRMKQLVWSAAALSAAVTLLPGCAMKLGKQPRQEVAPLYSAQSPEFRQAAGSLLGPNFIDGNSISTLVNGDQIRNKSDECFGSNLFDQSLCFRVHTAQREC